jgi:acid phosphatase
MALFICHGLAFGAVPRVQHVFIVLEENHSYSSVIGSSSMPYLNALAKRYGLATNYYANTHPSIGNYFMLTTGRIITNNDSFSGTVAVDNVVRHLLSAGKTWKSYAESLPYAGYIGGDTSAYMKHHNPFAYLSDVRNSNNERMNLVPFSRFKSDLANHQLPNFSFIIPNVMHDAHNGSLSAADNWLRSNIAPLIASSAFQNGGALIIVFDESSARDSAHGGGHVAAVVVSPKIKPGTRLNTFLQHQNVLKTALQLLGVSASGLGWAASASSIPGL